LLINSMDKTRKGPIMRQPKNSILSRLLELSLLLITVFLSLPVYSQINWAAPAHSWGGAGTEYADSIAKDSQVNVYVGGATSSFGAGGQDVLLLKYGPTGTLVWSKTWGGASDEYATAVAVGPDGFLYVTGGTSSFGAGWFDIFLLKLDLQGNLIWATTWGGGSYDVGHDIGFDASGNIYVVGEEYSFGPCCSSSVLLKFPASGGTPLGTTSWKGPATYDAGYSLAVDLQGNVIVAGISWDYSVFPHHNSILLIKYDAAGNHLWTKSWITSGQDESWSFRGVTTDAAGNIYVGNRHANQCLVDDFSQCDFDNLIIRVDAGGNFQWARLWGSPGYDNAGSLAIDPAGHLLVPSINDIFGVPELSLLSFDTSGTVLSKITWNTKTAPTMNLAGMVLDGTGTALIVGGGFSSSGLWGTADLPNVISLQDSFVTNSFSTNSPIGFSSQLTIPTELQNGITDVGGGIADAFITAVRPLSGPSCPLNSVEIDTSLSNGVVNAAVTGSPCEAQLTIENKQPYWTNFTIHTVGFVTAEPVGGDANLYARFGLLPPSSVLPLPPGKSVSYTLRFSQLDASVIVFADPSIATGSGAGEMNILQALLNVLPLGGLPVLVIDDNQKLVEAFAQMPDLQNAVTELFVNPPQFTIASRNLIDFLKNSSETSAFLHLLKNLGLNIGEEVLKSSLRRPGKILRIFNSLAVSFGEFRVAFFGYPAGSINLVAH
jgi:hypothetical protein